MDDSIKAAENRKALTGVLPCPAGVAAGEDVA